MAKFSSFGATIGIGTGLLATTPTYTTIAQVSALSGPSISGETVDVTTHDSPSGFRQFVAGLVDPGEVTFDLVFDYDVGTHANASGGILYPLHQRTGRAFKITFTDSTPITVVFDAFVTSFEPDMSIDGAMTASLTLKLTGVLTWA